MAFLRLAKYSHCIFNKKIQTYCHFYVTQIYTQIFQSYDKRQLLHCLITVFFYFKYTPKFFTKIHVLCINKYDYKQN